MTKQKKVLFIKMGILCGFLFHHHPASSQTTHQPIPNVLMTKEQRLNQLIVSQLDNYDKYIGKPFGKFSSTGGKTNITEQSLIGRITLVSFWFDGCAPCHLEFNRLNSIYSKYLADSTFHMIGFSFDSDSALAANRIKYGLLYRNISLPQAVCSDLIGYYHGYPTNFLVNQAGTIVFGTGGIYDDKQLNEIIIPKIDSLLFGFKSKTN